MTLLRDDGLETDNPAVAACFLGKTIGDWGELTAVRERWWVDRMHGKEMLHNYPILIPPTVVAETLEFAYLNDGTDGTGKRWTIASESLIYGTLHVWLPLVDIDGWLCAHTTVKEAR